MDTVVLSRG